MGEPLDFAKPLELVCDRAEVVSTRTYGVGLGCDTIWKTADGRRGSVDRLGRNWEDEHIVRNRVEGEWPAAVRQMTMNVVRGMIATKTSREPRFAIGDPVHVIVKREGQPRFPGYIIGSYTPLDGRHQGWVVEHERDGIIHVYPNAALAPGLE